MKKIFTLLSLYTISTFAQVSVGTGTEAYTWFGPINPYFEYSYTQTIYKATEINASGTITGLQYEMVHSDPILTADNEVDVWLGHTFKQSFNTNDTGYSSDWIGIENLTQVLTSGTVTKEDAIVTITFDTPFEYDGINNLVIAVDANETGSGTNSDMFYSTKDTQHNRVLYSNSNTENPDPLNTMYQGISKKYYANVTFLGISQTCPPPTNLTVENLTSTTAELKWENTEDVTTWDIELCFSGITQGNGTIIPSVSTNPFTISNLEPNTSYQFYVKSVCDSSNSSWVGPYTFTTPCELLTLPHISDMLNNPPSECWKEAQGILTGDLSYAPNTAHWKGGRSFTDIEGNITHSNVVNLYNTSHKSWLISPSFELLENNQYELKVITALTTCTSSGTSNHTNTSNMGSDDEVKLLISEDNGINWTEVTTWNAENQPLVTGTEFTYDLSSYSGAIKIAFWATDGIVDDTNDYDFHTGHFEVKPKEITAISNFSLLKFVMHPNPTENVVNIYAKDEVLQIEFFNLTGALTDKVKCNSNKVSVNTSKFTPGIYLVKVSTKHKVGYMKLIKK